MTDLSRDLALSKAINALSLLVEGLASPLGRPAWLREAAATVAEAADLVATVEQPNEERMEETP